uniref:Uncharacterized protein n=1 Tax=Anopheles atroparvus TaxID=41427 RepID=A0A182ISL4_ANOAO
MMLVVLVVGGGLGDHGDDRMMLVVLVAVVVEWRLLLGLQRRQEGIDWRVQVDGIRDGLHDTHRDGLYWTILLLMLRWMRLARLLRRLWGVELSGRSDGGNELQMHGDRDRLRGRHLEHVVVRHNRYVVDHHLALGIVEGDRLDEVRLGRPGERWNEWGGSSGGVLVDVAWRRGMHVLAVMEEVTARESRRCQRCYRRALEVDVLVELRHRVAGTGERIGKLDPIAGSSESTEESRAHQLARHVVMVMMVVLRRLATRQQRLHQHRNGVRRRDERCKVLRIVFIPHDEGTVVRHLRYLRLREVLFVRLFFNIVRFRRSDSELQLVPMAAQIIPVADAFHLPQGGYVALWLLAGSSLLLDEEVRLVPLVLETTVRQLDDVTKARCA